jgi:hypothetical protein
MIRQQVEHLYPSGARPVRRDQHPKAHGCVRAEFIVGDGVLPSLRHGLFKEPRAYAAWIRFSSSSSKIVSDAKRDAHGMAIKILGVPGHKVLPEERDETTHDFVLANNPVFFVRSAADYVSFVKAFTAGRLMRFFFAGNPLKWRLHELMNILQATQQSVSNPLDIRYWSQTPYRLGPHAVKYSARPRAPIKSHKPSSSSPDFLRKVMTRQLKTEQVTFDFMVQLQIDAVKMPVEDATVMWDESASPFYKVATLRIPPQVFDSPGQREFAENLSFTPWHALPEHRPLGNTNRIRRVVYQSISTLRHARNEVTRREPTE